MRYIISYSLLTLCLLYLFKSPEPQVGVPKSAVEVSTEVEDTQGYERRTYYTQSWGDEDETPVHRGTPTYIDGVPYYFRGSTHHHFETTNSFITRDPLPGEEENNDFPQQ